MFHSSRKFARLHDHQGPPRELKKSGGDEINKYFEEELIFLFLRNRWFIVLFHTVSTKQLISQNFCEKIIRVIPTLQL